MFGTLGSLHRWVGSVALLTCASAASAANEAGEAAACASCGAVGGLMIMVPLGVIALNIALLVWVARDAKARGMDSAVIWMLLVMAFSLLGWIIYLMSRPVGELVECASCHNKRLAQSAKCPHCANA